MAITRGVALCIGTVAVMTVAGLALHLWMNSLKVDFSYSDVWITGVQFDNDYLTVVVENNGTLATTIGEVTVNQTSTLYKVPVHEKIGAGKQISIRLGFKWTSGYAYQIELKRAENASYWWHPVKFLAVAP